MCLCWIYSVWRRRAARGGGRGDLEPEPIVGIAFTDWPPFTGCWHACYIKETPPTAAPDNLQLWNRRGGKRHSCPSCYMHHLWAEHFSGAAWNLRLSYFTIKYMKWPRYCTLLRAGSVLCDPGGFLWSFFYAWIWKLSLYPWLAATVIFCLKLVREEVEYSPLQ